MRHRFPGLPPTDLLSYLVGLGLGRVLALQSPGTEWAWDGDTLVIDTSIEDIPGFLVHDYQPTPVLSPWNNGSGFAPQDRNQRATLEKLLDAGERLPDWHKAVDVGRRLLDSPKVTGAAPAKKAKELLLRLLRNEWPDRAIVWLDASSILTQDGLSFPPLLGSGGNDGRLDFSTHFHNNLVAVLPEAGSSPARSLAWARSLRSGPHVGALASRPVGQFDASGAGSPRSGAFGSGRTLVNPWAYVLMLEGAVLFAAAPARRLGEMTSRAAWPFTVSGSPDGPAPGSAVEEVRGEVWVPVWSRPSSLREVEQVFAEARATWDGTTAKQAAHMYGAVRSFGADRRIDRFIRFGLAQRNGLAFLAIPLDDVRAEAAPGIELAIPISRRMSPMQRAESNALDVARRRADLRLVEFLRRTRPHDLLSALEAITLWELSLIRSSGGRGKVMHLPGRPSAQAVLGFCTELLSDAAEVRLAAALAGGATLLGDSGSLVSTRDIVLGVLPERGKPGQWQSPMILGLGGRPLVDVLGDAAVWCEQHGAVAHTYKGGQSRGARVASISGIPALWQDTHAWARNELDEAYLQTAYLAFLALDWSKKPTVTLEHRSPQIPLPELSLLQSFNSGDVRLPDSSTDQPRIQGLAPGWLLRLRAGQTESVLADAVALLNRSDPGHRPWNRAPGQHRRPHTGEVAKRGIPAVQQFSAPIPSVSGRRLIAALMAPLSRAGRPTYEFDDSPSDPISHPSPPTQEAAEDE